MSFSKEIEGIFSRQKKLVSDCSNYKFKEGTCPKDLFEYDIANLMYIRERLRARWITVMSEAMAEFIRCSERI